MAAKRVSRGGEDDEQSGRGAAPRSRTGKRLYAAAAAVMFAFLLFEAVKYGWAAWVIIFVFLALPDLALIGGFRDDLARGQLAPRNVPIYNLLHSYGTALALMVLSLFPWPELWLRPGLEFFLAGFAMATHITIDRTFGFGLRTRDGHQR